MKKISTFGTLLLMGAVTLGFASCGDDDDDAGNVSNSSYTHCPDENHPHAIDLGLPSGLKWACCNVGASSPYEDGDYFAWGEVEHKTYYDWDTYKWSDGSNYTKYTSSGKTTLDAEDDAATHNWGENFRMPTVDEFVELLANCTSVWTKINGVYGYKLTSNKNSAFVFFPATGHRSGAGLEYQGYNGNYWSSSLYPYDERNAHDLYFTSGGVDPGSDHERTYGQSVRAVCP